jgi:hypothetical protein
MGCLWARGVGVEVVGVGVDVGLCRTGLSCLVYTGIDDGNRRYGMRLI